jgi:hypothetical protein
VHRNGGLTVRRCKLRRVPAFIGGEGAPVVAGGGDEVLHLGRGEGVRDLQEISGIGSSGRSSPGSGGRRRCSAGIHEGAVGKLGRSREGVGEEWGWEDEWSSASGERAARRQRGRGERGGKKVGVLGVGVPRGAGVPWGLAPTGRQCPVAARAQRSRATYAAHARAGRIEQGERELTGGPRHSAERRCR